LKRNEVWKLVALLTLCWAIISTSLASYYYVLSTIQPSPSSMELGRVVLIIDYGNKTVQIFNLTTTLPSSLFNLTVAVAEVEYSTFAGIEGVFIDSINGVSSDYVNNRYWTWWIWNGEEWVEGPVAADLYMVGEGQIICWYYSSFDPSTFISEKPHLRIYTMELRE